MMCAPVCRLCAQDVSICWCLVCSKDGLPGRRSQHDIWLLIVALCDLWSTAYRVSSLLAHSRASRGYTCLSQCVAGQLQGTLHVCRAVPTMLCSRIVL